METLTQHNGNLEKALLRSQQDLLKKTEALKSLALRSENEHDSLTRQIQFNKETNESLNDRLDASTKILQEVSAQRDHLESQCISLSKKFVQYKEMMDMLFKVLCTIYITTPHQINTIYSVPATQLSVH